MAKKNLPPALPPEPPAAPPPPAADDGDLAGLTRKDCPAACNPMHGCIITRGGSGICAHPKKTGLPSSADALDAGIVARYGRARKIIEHQNVDK